MPHAVQEGAERVLRLGYGGGSHRAIIAFSLDRADRAVANHRTKIAHSDADSQSARSSHNRDDDALRDEGLPRWARHARNQVRPRAMRALVEELDHPEQSYATLLIAGTNGKGSVAACVDAVLRASSLRTGLYTSPHLIRVHERIRVDGQEISGPSLARAVSLVREAADRLVARGAFAQHPTYFEVLTGAAFAHFQTAAGRRRRARGGARGKARRDERRRAARFRDREHRSRPPGVPGRLARFDRGRESGRAPRRADHGPGAAPGRGSRRGRAASEGGGRATRRRPRGSARRRARGRPRRLHSVGLLSGPASPPGRPPARQPRGRHSPARGGEGGAASPWTSAG